MKIISFFLFVWATVATYFCFLLSDKETITKPINIDVSEEASCAAPSSAESTVKVVENKIVPSGQSSSSSISSGNEVQEYRVDAKIAAIEKFVQINNVQREQLREKYLAELRKEKSSSLDDILGKESADFYKQEVIKAYEKNHQEEIDREVFYLARILNLNNQQEVSVRQVVSDVKNSIDYVAHQSKSENQVSKIKSMLDSVKIQNDLFAEKMKNVLSAEQYKAFIEYQNNSSDADFAILHSEPN